MTFNSIADKAIVHLERLRGGGWREYALEIWYAIAGLFAIDITWRIMDNFIDHWLIPHAQYLNWLIGSN